jgi:deoxyhypusine synthase
MKIAPKLDKFEPLELDKCHTVGQILEAMSKTPVGSGMLGRLAVDLRDLIVQDMKPLVIFDGFSNSPIAKLLEAMSRREWFSEVITPEQYVQHGEGEEIIVIGRFSERYEDHLYLKPSRAFFVNQWGLANPSQMQDGHFKDVVVADPSFILPLLYTAFDEWFNDRPWLIDGKERSLLSLLERFGGTAAEFVRGARVLKAMTDDSDCTVVFTATGVLTVAQMSPIVCDLIDAGKIQVIVTTGALLGHGLVYSLDLPHFRHNPNLDDATLADFKLNRITDAIEPETNLDHVEEVIGAVLKGIPDGSAVSSSYINWLIGEHLRKHFPDQRGILKSAVEKNVPVIIPAPYDSELGNDNITHNRRLKLRCKKPILVNLELDTERLIEILTGVGRRGIFTLGGGPPRNTAQNISPLVEILNNRLGLDMPIPMYQYGCRVCPDPIWLGHLSGCTYNEGMSWRKMDPHGQFAEVHMDAMHAFPFLAKYVLS